MIDFIDILEDKQVIQELLQSKVMNNSNISIIEGQILKVDKAILHTLKNNENVYCSVVTMQDKNSKLYELKHQVLLDINSIDTYKAKLEPHYNNIVALVEPKNNDLLVRCYLKKYEDIDYNNKK